MTAVRERARRTPPRFAVRIAWMLHRGLYRLRGGRFGLSRPEAGSKSAPEKAAMARPTGVGRALATYEIPIEGRDEWLAAARRLA
jgi:hypothetical protein